MILVLRLKPLACVVLHPMSSSPPLLGGLLRLQAGLETLPGSLLPSVPASDYFLQTLMARSSPLSHPGLDTLRVGMCLVPLWDLNSSWECLVHCEMLDTARHPGSVQDL